MTEDLHIFVYGTLKPGAANFDRYCGSKVVNSQRAYIYGALYHLPLLGYPGAIQGNRQVHGFILSFDDATILEKLDELEDYDPHRNPAENDYNRELVPTYAFDRAASPVANQTPGIFAWAYFMTLPQVQKLGGILLPDGCWAG